MKKIFSKETLGWLSLINYLLIVAYTMVYEFNHPELTNTQMSIDLWWVFILAPLCGYSIVKSSILKKIKEEI